MLSREKISLSFLCLFIAFTLNFISGCENSQGIADSASPPEIVFTTPEDNAGNISVTTSVTAVFDQPMEESSINSSSFALRSDTDTLSGLVSTNDTTAVFSFSDSLEYGTTYQASLTEDVSNASGESLPSRYQWSFTTEQEQKNQEDEGGDGDNNGDENDDGDDETGDNQDDNNNDDGDNDQDEGDESGDDMNNGDENGDENNGEDEDSDDNGQEDDNDGEGDGTEDDQGGGSDTVPPSVTDIDPDENTAGISVDVTISATFNEAMDESTIHTETVVLQGPSGPVEGTVNTVGNEITFSPDDNLDYSSEYTFTITTEAADIAGNQLQREYIMIFSTEEDNTPPRVLSTDPTRSESDLPVDIDIKLTFNEEIDPNSVELTLYDSGIKTGYPGTISVSENVMTFSPDSSFRYSGTFELILFDAKDLAGNSIESEFFLSFSTMRPPVMTPVTVLSANPGDAERNVPIDSEITVVFSAEMYPFTFNENTVTLEGPDGEVPARLNADDDTLHIIPRNELEYGSSYTYTIASGIRDIYRNHLEEEFSATFTTEEGPVAEN